MSPYFIINLEMFFTSKQKAMNNKPAQHPTPAKWLTVQFSFKVNLNSTQRSTVK